VLNRLQVRNRLPFRPPPAAAIPRRDHCSHEIASGKTDPEAGGDARAIDRKSDKQRTHNHYTTDRTLAPQLRRSAVRSLRSLSHPQLPMMRFNLAV
jgi:hypothetical protein